MDKFFKSIFMSEKKRNRYEGGSDEDKQDFTPPLDDRRKLSISRSGRLRQNNKKRHSLTLDVYGEINQTIEKPKLVEYHVNPINSVASESKKQRRRSVDPKLTEFISDKGQEPKPDNKRKVEDIKTPEEEIESAFEIIDKVL